MRLTGQLLTAIVDGKYLCNNFVKIAAERTAQRRLRFYMVAQREKANYMNHWMYKTAGVLLAGSMAAMFVLEPVSAGSAAAGSALGRVADSAYVTDIPETGRLLLPACGVQYALAAKKVSLRDVKSAAAPESGSSEAASAKAVGSAALYAAGTKSTQEPASGETSAAAESSEEPAAAAAEALTETAAEETAETVEAGQETASVQTQPAESGDVILDTSLTPTQQKEQELVLTAGEVVSVDASTAAELAAGAGQTQESAASASAEAAAVQDTAAETSTETAAESDTASNLVVSTAADYVNIRKDPAEDAEVVGKLYAGSVGTVTAPVDANGWVEITSGSVTGYVKSDYVATGSAAQQMADTVGTQKAIVTTETLRVRAAASEDADVISLIGQGQSYEILGEENGWYKVNTEDGEGYISADFTDVEVQYPEAVSIAEEKAEEAAKKAEAAQKESEEKQKAAAASASKGQAVVDYAMQFLGNPYVWGGSSLTKGTDCSGFTMAVYAHFGVSLPHYDAAQRSCGTAVSSLSKARAGDLICYYGHVGIYIGNGQIINASNPRGGIKISSATYRQIAAIRRIFN